MKVKSIRKIKYKGFVHNLAVMGDETFFANNILVHNCRSILVPILLGEKDLPGYFENYEDTFKPFGYGATKTRPDPGFGG